MIHTAGYSGRKLDDFQAAVAQLDAFVVDIRLVPQSRFFPAWRKSNLEKVFGDRYRHVKELGNTKFKEKRIAINDLDAGLEVIMQIEGDVILLCACKDRNFCHRKIIGEALEERGFSVKELS